MRKDCTGRGVKMKQGEQGFMLVGLVVAIFLILLALSVAAPKVAQDLRREREVEAVHRGNQYVRAIQLYYKKMNSTYPGSMEQLEKSNNIRFLRQRYVDPITGKVDWRLIHVGEAKTTVKGFFGQPLAGLAPGLGAAANMVSSGTGQPGASSSIGSPGAGGYGASSPGIGGMGGVSSGPGGLGASGASTLGGGGATGAGAGGTAAGSSGSSTPGSTSGIPSQSASSFTGGGAPFVGVGVPKEGESITVLNEQTTYNTWEFIYDPRIEQLKAKASLFGGGVTSGSPGMGTVGGMSSGYGTTPTTPTTGPGAPTIGTPSTSPTTPTTPQQPQ
jgi:type II secretory pathway pseudopilin PulG